jgi:hypothetical protein
MSGGPGVKETVRETMLLVGMLNEDEPVQSNRLT